LEDFSAHFKVNLQATMKAWSTEIVPAIEAYAAMKRSEQELDALKVAFGEDHAALGLFFDLFGTTQKILDIRSLVSIAALSSVLSKRNKKFKAHSWKHFYGRYEVTFGTPNIFQKISSSI
jgi:hypothetical protein